MPRPASSKCPAIECRRAWTERPRIEAAFAWSVNRFCKTPHGRLPAAAPLVNQLTNTLKAYYPRALEIAELTTTQQRVVQFRFACDKRCKGHCLGRTPLDCTAFGVG
jgi:hypothetical protein